MNETKPYYRCARVGCSHEGKWLPMLVINMVGQTDVEKPVTCGLPMFLCDNHKKEFEPATALTWEARLRLGLLTVAKRRKRLNWDTIRVDWRQDKEAERILVGLDGKPLH